MLRTRRNTCASTITSPRRAPTLNQSSSSVMPESERRGGERWPVLARLADVSDQLTTAPMRSRRAAASAGLINYRFDPPQGARVGDDPTGAAERTQPHVFQRLPRRVSPILPHSNPFAIPATGLWDRVAPTVRFLVWFALFTVVGTMLLTISRRDTPASKSVRPQISSGTGPRARLSAEPAAEALKSLEPAVSASERTKAVPTAVGPLGVIPRSENPNPQSTPATTVEPLPAGTSDHPLPQVQTFDPQSIGVEGASAQPKMVGDDPARVGESNGQSTVARLSGYVLPAPARQASHDDNQPIIH